MIVGIFEGLGNGLNHVVRVNGVYAGRKSMHCPELCGGVRDELENPVILFGANEPAESRLKTDGARSGPVFHHFRAPGIAGDAAAFGGL